MTLCAPPGQYRRGAYVTFEALSMLAFEEIRARSAIVGSVAMLKLC